MDEQNYRICIALNLDQGFERYTLLYRGIQDYAKKYCNWTRAWNHYPDKLLSTCSPDQQPSYDGVIGRIKFAAYDEMKRLNIPGVNIWYNSDLTEIPSSLPNYVQAGRLAARHMLSRGFKNFINIDYMDRSSTDFFAGIKEELKPHRYPCKRYRFNRKSADSSAAWDKQMKTFKTWIPEWEFPLAVCSSAPIIAVAPFCQENNLRIPEDLAIIVSGNQTSYCESIEPHISAVDIDYWRIGYEAARLMDKQLKGEELENIHHKVEPLGVVARDSTDTYATDDDEVRVALRYIADNIQNGIIVSDIVEQVSISRSSLENRFKEATGHTIKDEIDRLRVISAKRLLGDRKIKIKTIFKKTGFSSALHMRRVFTKVTGMTPSDFRQSLKE